MFDSKGEEGMRERGVGEKKKRVLREI